jgi:arsenite methyltransferase
MSNNAKGNLMTNNVHESVKDYYGKQLQASEDLKTNACCTMVAPPKHIINAIKNVHDEVSAKYYGCGLTVPTCIEGLRVLDLGSGSGRDCYIAAQLVGEKGKVVGVDMTDEQLEVANKYIDYHAEKFGFNNVEFKKGYIEKLDELGLDKGSFDLIISNCVINLASDKKKVLQDAYDLLEEGGEMYFSDVYADRRVPDHLQKDEVLYGECLSGALYWNDFLQISKEVGFKDPRVIESKTITIENKELEEKVGDIKFYSVTYRLFKMPRLEADCEDYGHAVTYLGTVSEEAESFLLDSNHIFKKGEKVKVCGNSYLMLHESRFAKHFSFEGSFDTHYGIFEGCGGSAPFNSEAQSVSCC